VSSFRYQEHPPPPDLAWAVECFWEAEGPAGGVERIVPDGRPELVVQLGGAMLAADDGAALRPQPRALLVGQRSQALQVSPRQAFRTVAVRLRPGALGAVLRGHSGALTDGWGALEELFGLEARSLVARLEEASDTPMRRAALETFLRRRPRARSGFAGTGLAYRARGRVTVRTARGHRRIRALARACVRPQVGLPETWPRCQGRPRSAPVLRTGGPAAAELRVLRSAHQREFRRHAKRRAALLESPPLPALIPGSRRKRPQGRA
jgi:hypothetical protein